MGRSIQSAWFRLGGRMRKSLFLAVFMFSLAAVSHRQRISATAAGRAPGKSSRAKLQIDSVTAGVDVEVDGNFVGSTASDVQVAEGDHAVDGKNPGFQSWERKLKCSVGNSVLISAELEKAV